MQSPPVPRYLVPPRSKYSPQHLILKHPQPPFLPQCQRPSFTLIHNRQDYSFIVITTPDRKVPPSPPHKPSHQFTIGEQLDRFDVDMVGKPFFVLLSGLSNFIRNHLHLKAPVEVRVSDIPRCNNDVPKYLVLKSLNDVSVALFRASPQLYAVGPHIAFNICTESAYCVSTGPIFFL